METKPWYELRDYQSKVLDELKDEDYVGVVAACLGSGKTIMGVESIYRTGAKRVLIVAPLRTYPGWQRTLEGTLHQCDGTKQGKVNLELAKTEQGYYFIGYERLRLQKDLLKWKEFDLIIADEVHRIGRHSTLTNKAIVRLKAKHKIGLSATPAGNKPENIFGVLKWLWPKMYSSYYRFLDMYFETEKVQYLNARHPTLVVKKEKNEGLIRKVVPCYIELSGVLDIPEIVVHKMEVKLSRQQYKQYMEFEKQALAWLSGNPVATSLPITQEMRLRQATLGDMVADPYVDITTGELKYNIWFEETSKSSKIDMTLDILSDLPPGEKVIIWCHSQRFMTPLVAQLRKAGYKTIEVSGKSKDDFKDFIEGDVQIICAVIAAMSEGVDGLQHVCSTEIWLSLDTSLILNKQAEGRLHRSGQTKPINRYLIQAQNTIDSKVLGRLDDRYLRLQKEGLI